MGTHNYHFNNEEDARNWSEQVGGTVYNNTHSPGDNWKYNLLNNSYTVHTETIENEKIRSGHVTMSKEKHEAWMQMKGWSEHIKEKHRDEFDKCDKSKYSEINMYFDEYGGFVYDY